MARIFGRNTTRPHGTLSSVLEKMLLSAEESERAIAWNLLHDDRVSESRADHFFHFTGQPSTPAQLLAALRTYVVSFIQERDPLESYLAPENSRNFLSLTPKPAFDLCHLVNVSGILYQLRNSVSDPSSMGLDLAHYDNAEMAISTAKKPEYILTLVDRMLGAYFVLRRSRPIWAAKWKDLTRQHLSDLDGKSWNQTVGVWRENETIQFMVRYSARKPLRLVRPTQLDIGPFQYHFPSPVATAVELGGFCMLLRDLESKKRKPLVSEFIHPPFQFTSKHWLRSGAKIDLISPEMAGTIVGYRRQHLERLKAVVPETIAWNL